MRNLLIPMLIMFVTACANDKPNATTKPTVTLADGSVVVLDAVCDGLRKPLDDLVDIVLKEGTNAIVIATENVAVKYDKGCMQG